MESWYKPSRQQRKEMIWKAQEERQKAWDNLSTMEKIKELDRRLGINQGAKKQRARLKAQLEAEHVKESKVKDNKVKENKVKNKKQYKASKKK